MQSPEVGLQLEQWVVAGFLLQHPELSEARNLPVAQPVQTVLSPGAQFLQLATVVVQQADASKFKNPEEHPIQTP